MKGTKRRYLNYEIKKWTGVHERNVRQKNFIRLERKGGISVTFR